MRDQANNQKQEGLWISASQHGDVAAFNHLVLKWEKSIYNTALRMLRNPAEAEEATQEVFLLAFKNIRRFRLNSRFSTWIYRIALNYCLTCIKKQRPSRNHLPIDDENSEIHSVRQLAVVETQDRSLLRMEQRTQVFTALMRLHPEQQAVIELKFFQEMTFEEIASVLDVPLSTIKSRLYSGLELLKIRLGNGFLIGRRESI